jgi:hypothetical protein
MKMLWHLSFEQQYFGTLNKKPEKKIYGRLQLVH